VLFYKNYYEAGLKEWENIPITVRKKCPECPDSFGVRSCLLTFYGKSVVDLKKVRRQDLTPIIIRKDDCYDPIHPFL